MACCACSRKELAHQRGGDSLIEVRSVGRSGLDLLTLSSSHIDRYCRKSLFAPSGSNFKSRWLANEKITWGVSSLGGELTGDFGSQAEGLSNGDRRLFCLSAGN